ncbi:MAG: hypothetical protein ACI8VI_001131 [Granulosicoccus sp.]|jgi:hypothetical protein
MLLERDYPDFTLNLVEQGKSSPRAVERDFSYSDSKKVTQMRRLLKGA